MFDSDDLIAPLVQVGAQSSPLPVVTAALIGAGLPAEAAVRFADVAVEAVRVWLWETEGRGGVCICGTGRDAPRELEAAADEGCACDPIPPSEWCPVHGEPITWGALDSGLGLPME